MDKVITTSLLIAVSMILVLALFNATYPAVIEGGDAITGMAARSSERMDTQIKIIHAAGELDQAGGWSDNNLNSDFEVFLWVKNIGERRLNSLDQLDVFFGEEGNFMRVPHQNNSGGSYPYWTWELENAAEWTPTATLKLTIHYSTPLASNRYFSRVALSNGVADEYILGL